MSTPLSAATATRLEKVAVDNGFDRDLARVGAWLAFASTQTTLRLWLTTTDDAMFLAALSQHHVAAGLAELGQPIGLGLAAPLRTVRLDDGHRRYLSFHRERVFSGPVPHAVAAPLHLSAHITTSGSVESAFDRYIGIAKSAFHFDVPGSVAKSTHAGLPWLRYIRQQMGHRVHFWPFDGWAIRDGLSAVVEVYPSLWRETFLQEDRTDDQHDAYSVAAWLREADREGTLADCLNPPLGNTDRATAIVEGWILGAGGRRS